MKVFVDGIEIAVNDTLNIYLSEGSIKTGAVSLENDYSYSFDDKTGHGTFQGYLFNFRKRRRHPAVLFRHFGRIS